MAQELTGARKMYLITKAAEALGEVEVIVQNVTGGTSTPVLACQNLQQAVYLNILGILTKNRLPSQSECWAKSHDPRSSFQIAWEVGFTLHYNTPIRKLGSRS